ncbi:hypothetical protein OG394_28635 [Kribbella sp. NBC_01245]|uniref:hypothetical protein n=1 Tax=Kribbella sp. NBC_01245 TaxID=2903578 RepID=UPI002E2A6C57|nr:hypothetical protein [Kribbella sp. NBC_01245]
MAEVKNVRDLVAALAKTAVTTVLTGPVGGVGVAASTAIETVAARFPKRAVSPYERAVSQVSASLEAWALGERIPAEDLRVGLIAAADALATYGLSIRGIVREDMDGDRAAAVVLKSASLNTLSEAEEQVCRQAVIRVYRLLVADQALLPGLDVAFRQEVLARLDGDPAGEGDTTPVVQLLTLQTPTWTPVLHPPSALLRAAYRVVPFHGRESELDELNRWRRSDEPLQVRLVTGPGGMGKTRLLIEASLQARLESWYAGFLVAPNGRPESWPIDLARRQGDLLVVIDYAETRRQDVVDLLAEAVKGRQGRVRLVLLARARGEWWDEICRTHGTVGDLLTGPATTVNRLGPLVPQPADRPEVVAAAAQRFAELVGTEPTPTDQSFAAADFERVLFLHLAALQAAMGGGDESAQGLLDAALRREQALWDDGARAISVPWLIGRPLRQAAALVTLAGQVSTSTQAVELLRNCPLLADQPNAVLDDVAELFHRLYPGPNWLEGVQPDLVGEHLVAQALADDPGLLAIFDAVH